MDIENDPHAERDRETSDSVLDAFDRRSVLRTLGTGLVAFGGTSGSVLAQTDQNSESSDRLFEVSYGTNSELVAPFNGTEPITDVYDYSGYTADIELQKEDTARLFLYDGPNGLSLGTVIDSTSSDDGGQTGYEIDGFPADGAWVIKDDSGDTYGTAPAWSWDSGGNTDGGVIRGGFDGEFEITITPELNQGRDDPDNDEDGTVDGWEFVYGEFENGSFQNVEVIDLKVNGEPQSVTITPSGQQTEAEVPEPSIDPASVRLSRTAVEAQADEQGPTLEVTVSNAEDVRAELNAETVRPEVYDEGDFEFTMNEVDSPEDPMNEVDSPEVPMLPEQYRSTEDSDRERYRTTFVIPDVEPGDWVPITIVAEGPGGTAELTEYSPSQQGDAEESGNSSFTYHANDIGYNEANQYTEIGRQIGFGVFERILAGPMIVIGGDDEALDSFAKEQISVDKTGDSGNLTDEYKKRRIEILRLLERAREHDLNRALVSDAMTMGGIGVNIRFNDNNGRLYTVPGSIEDDYSNVEGEGGLFNKAIEEAGDISYNTGEDAFRAVTHLGLGPGSSGRRYRDGVLNRGKNNVYISNLGENRVDQTLGTELEELLHADGYADLYQNTIKYPIKGNLDDIYVDLFGEGSVLTLSTGTRLADTIGLKVYPLESFSDLLDYEEVPVGKETSFKIPKLTEYDLNDTAKVLSLTEGRYPLLIPELREIQGEPGVLLYRADTIGENIGEKIVSTVADPFNLQNKLFNIITERENDDDPLVINQDDRRSITPSLETDYDLFIEFTRDENKNKLIIRKELPTARTDYDALNMGKMIGIPAVEASDAVSTTEQISSKQVDSETSSLPTPSLRAIDTNGRITGYNYDGEYVRNIPGSRASGDQGGGLEWIEVPQEIDAEFEVVYPSVDGTDTQEVSAYCEVAEASYDADAELTVTDEGTTVEGVQKEMHRGTVEPDQTVQTTELSLPEEDSQSTEQPTEQEQTQEQVTEAADTESNEDSSVDIDVEGVPALPPAQVGGALAAGVTAAYLLKRRL